MGAYDVTVWLKGPYENRTVLYKKVFNLTMALTATVSPTTWGSWEENVTITVVNTGDVPLIVEGVGMVMPDTGNSIGLISAPTAKQGILVIMRGETKAWVGTPEMFGDSKIYLSGKTLKIDFCLDVAGAPQQFVVTENITFPSPY